MTVVASGPGNRNTEERMEMMHKGEAMPPDGAYPIGTRDELSKAIKAVGRGNAPGSTIRRHIMKRARAMGATDMIPESWTSGGQLAASLLAEAVEVRAAAGRTFLLTGQP
jgi:hypothetical protein